MTDWVARTALEALSEHGGDPVRIREYARALDDHRSNWGALNSLISELSADQPGEAGPVVDQPLRGVPFVVKDNIGTAALPTTGGCPFLKSWQPGQDAPVVERLRAVGAVLIGKANMHELGFGVTSNNGGFGAVRNPHNLLRSAGGSSGGTAAAVAAGLVPFGLATDTGGSARIPASFCGVYGFRPSTSRYPHEGVLPISPTRDTVGVMARGVADIQLVDGVLAADNDEPPEIILKNLRIGVPRDFFFDDLEKDVAANIEKALETMASAGVSLVQCKVDRVGELDEAAGFPIALFEARREWENFLVHNQLGTLDNLRSELASPDVAGVFAAMIDEVPVPANVYEDAVARLRPELQEEYRKCFGDGEFDALVFPTVVRTAPELGQDEEMSHNGRNVPVFPTISRNTSPGSVAGIPGLTMPVGTDRNDLPVGLEIDGPEGADRQLLAIGSALSELFQKTVPPVRPG